jgi:hypothetical protein
MKTSKSIGGAFWPPLILAYALAGLAACKGKESAAPAAAGTGSLSASAKTPALPPLTIRFQGGAGSPDSLIRAFMENLIAQKGQEAYSFLPSFSEYAALYPHMPESDGNPDSPRMISGMLISSNRKELPRWMKDAESLKGFSRYELGPTEKHDGYELVTGVRLYVLDEKGKETEFPLFRTLIRIGDRYKIWLLLEH